uniref:Bacterial transcriptional activator domain-containing protein n=1 Tax=Desulfacinum infernum TaxID=35837 RepID=A0A832A3E4_9BACT
MDRLHLYLFGGFRVLRGRPPQTVHLTRTAQHLLAYLVVHRHRLHPREVLAGTLWGETDNERGRACLNTALWRLRKVLEPPGVPKGTFFHSTAAGEVGLRRDAPWWADVAAFEEKLHIIPKSPLAGLSIDAAAEVEKVLPLYTGELLEGFYDDWVLQERERVHCLYVEALEALMHHYKNAGDIPRSLAFAQRLLKVEPFREDIHLAAMKMYQEIGQRFMALRQYEKCRESLEKEIGVRPSRDTRRYYEEIAPGRRGESPGQDEGRAASPDALGAAMDVLQKALHSLEAVHRDVMEAMSHVTELLKYPPSSSIQGPQGDGPSRRRR